MGKTSKRFKRMLFGFFKEEILEAAGYDTKGWHASATVVQNMVEFDTMVMEHVIEISDNLNIHGLRPLGAQIEEAKRSFARNVMENIRVDCRDILDPNIYDAKKIRLSLMVQKKPLY